MKKYINKIYYLVVVLLFLMGSFLLLYKLSLIPNGIHIDEAGCFYDAVSMIKYGVDRYLYKYPVYLINFGGGQSCLYMYMASLFFRVFGISLWSYRLVSVVISLISYYYFYKLARLYKGRVFSIFVLFLLVILPIYIMKARWGLDCYLFNPLMIISIYFYVKAIKGGRNIFYIISGILFGISFYTYILSCLIIPIFLIISIIYLFIKKKINILNIISMLIPVTIMGIPLLLMVLISKGIISDEIILGFISIPKMWFFRGGEISFSNIRYFFSNLCVMFFGDHFNYNSIIKFGSMYYISIPFIVGGFIILIYRIIKKKSDYLDIIMFILFICVFVISLFIVDININKINCIYICFVYFISIFLDMLYRYKYRLVLLVILCLYGISFILFSFYYFNEYNDEDLIYFEDDSLYEAIEFANDIRKDRYIYLGISNGYIYTLLYDGVDPYSFNDNANILTDVGIVFSYSYYKYYLLSNDEFNNKNYIYIVRDGKEKDILNGLGYKCVKFSSYYVYYYE